MSDAMTHDRRYLWSSVRLVLAVVLLAAVASWGGLAATRVWPVATQTDYLAAQVSLAPSVGQTSTVHTPTVFGDIDVEFDGLLPAPGIEAQVQVRQEITDLFQRKRLNVTDFQPDEGQLASAIDEAITGLAWRFVAGALVTAAICAGLYAVGRRRRSRAKLALAWLIASTLAVGAPGLASYLTYRPGTVTTYRATSLLATVQQGSGLFAAITGQAQAASPYLQNLFALSNALQLEFAPPEVAGEAGARFLLISDMHGANYYPLVKQIVDTEQITAVIDTGDLINFGLVEEGELADIYTSVGDLGVPYVYVRGNHDAASAGDEAFLDRMAQIPNVIVLEPNEGEYQEAAINGVTISGFNDVRFFNERREDFGTPQVEIADRFQEATAGRTPSDIVVSHQPYAVRRIQASAVTLNGHMHRAELDGQRIGIGTFSGGGLFNHFIFSDEEGEEPGGEVQGQPYAFDILTFGQDCSVDSLARFSFRNLVSGRPQYDDVSLINGSTIDPDPPQDRTCGPEQPLRVTPIEPASP
ncbi:MAG: metallophosphoesterase [Ornithinimicrobium sp.]